jgi:hypothetical protein
VGVEDVITIHISPRAVRTTLLVLAAFFVVGVVVPFVLTNVGGGHSSVVPRNARSGSEVFAVAASSPGWAVASLRPAARAPRIAPCRRRTHPRG